MQFFSTSPNLTSTSRHGSIIVFEAKVDTIEGTRMCENAIFDQPTVDVGSGTLTYMRPDEDDDGVPDAT
jgi:hypothetical protein